MNLLRPLAWRTWQLSCMREHAAFAKALHQPQAAQLEILAGLLAQAEDCAFAKLHGLRPGLAPEDFAKALPVREPADFDPFIARIRQGEQNVLTRGQVKRLVPTSGSTGPQKLVPYTAGLLAEFDRSVRAHAGDLLARHPGIRGGTAYFATSPAMEVGANDQGHSAVPIGWMDDGDYLGPVGRRVHGAVLAVPAQVSRLRGEAWRDATREGLRQADLRLLSLWHPSFLDAVLEDDFPAWKNLRVISCWADGPAAAAAQKLAARFPHAALEPKGLLMTEGALSIPFMGRRPAAVRGHYLEFEQADGRTVPVHALETGGDYRPVLTTGGGLWRQRTGDLVRVDGFLHRTPCLRFVGRADAVCDLAGEKLSEAHTAAALAARPGVFALLVPTQQLNGYALLTSAPDGAAFAAQVDASLCANPHYAWCRQAGQLAPVCAVPAPADGAARVLARDRAEGRMNPKPRALDKRDGWQAWMEGAAP